MLCLEVPDIEGFCDYGRPRTIRVVGRITEDNVERFERSLVPLALQRGDLMVDLREAGLAPRLTAAALERLAAVLPDGHLIVLLDPAVWPERKERWAGDRVQLVWSVTAADRPGPRPYLGRAA